MHPFFEHGEEEGIILLRVCKDARNNIFHDFTNSMLWSDDEIKKDELAEISIVSFNIAFNAFCKEAKDFVQIGNSKNYNLSSKGVYDWSLKKFNEL